MKKRLFAPLVAAAFVLLCGLAAFAQMTPVQGIIKDQNGQGIQGAQVVWHNTDNNREYKLKTNKKGEYQAIGVMVGHYNVIVMIDGKEATRKDNFELKSSGDSLSAPSYDFTINTAAQGNGAGSTGPTATPPPLTDEQLKQLKMSKEDQEKYKEAQEKNKKVEEENKVIGNVNTLMTQARDLMNAKPADYDKAVTLAQQATQVGANYDLTWGVLGDAELGAKSYQEAVDAYQKAIQINTGSSKPNPLFLAAWSHNQGRALMKLQKYTEATAAYETAAKDDPTHAAKNYFDAGAELMNAGRLDEAAAEFDKAIGADPNYADAYFQKGMVLVGKSTMQGTKMVAPPGTEEALQKYLELAPNGPNAASATEVLQTLGAKVKTTYKK